MSDFQEKADREIESKRKEKAQQDAAAAIVAKQQKDEAAQRQRVEALRKWTKDQRILQTRRSLAMKSTVGRVLEAMESVRNAVKLPSKPKLEELGEDGCLVQIIELTLESPRLPALPEIDEDDTWKMMCELHFDLGLDRDEVFFPRIRMLGLRDLIKIRGTHKKDVRTLVTAEDGRWYHTWIPQEVTEDGLKTTLVEFGSTEALLDALVTWIGEQSVQYRLPSRFLVPRRHWSRWPD